MKSYSSKIHKLITENKTMSLRILLEEEEDKNVTDDSNSDADDESKDASSDSSNDLFSDDSLEDKDSDSSDSDSSDSDSSDTESSSDSADDISKISPEDFEQKAKELKGIIKSQEKSMQDAQSSGVEGSIDAYATAEVLKSLGERYYSKSIKSFLFEADDDKEKSDIEKESENNEEKLKDAQKKVDNYVEGQNLNVNAVVDSIENAIEHFTTLFDVNRIVYEKFSKVIISYCGSKADDYLQQIKDEMADRGYMGDYAKETLYKVAVGSVKN